MIITEIDIESSRREIIPKLQKILDDLETNNITKSDAITLLNSIMNDIKVRAQLTSVTKNDAFEWQFLLLTVQNLISELVHD